MRPIALILLVVFLAVPAPQGRPLPDYETFAALVKARLATDEERQSGYMFIERRTEQKLDGSGRPKGESVKVFEVYPGLPGEDRYRRMIEEDGKPVPQGKLALKDRATFQRRKVNNEIWLPEQVTWTASARVLLLKHLRLRGVSEFSGYRKFTVDTSTTYKSPPP